MRLPRLHLDQLRRATLRRPSAARLLLRPVNAIVLAAAGVLRLGFGSHIAEYLSFEVMLPAPGQGALAVQCRADDEATRALLQPIDHAPTGSAVLAERAFLSGLGGGCCASGRDAPRQTTSRAAEPIRTPRER